MAWRRIPKTIKVLFCETDYEIHHLSNHFKSSHRNIHHIEPEVPEKSSTLKIDSSSTLNIPVFKKEEHSNSIERTWKTQNDQKALNEIEKLEKSVLTRRTNFCHNNSLLSGSIGKAPVKIQKPENLNTSEATLSPGLPPAMRSPVRSNFNNRESREHLPMSRKTHKNLSINPANFSTMPSQKEDSQGEADSNNRPCSLSPVRNQKSSRIEGDIKPTGIRQGYRSKSIYHSFIQKKKETLRADLDLQLKLYRDQATIAWKTEESDEWDNIEQNLSIGFKMGEGGFGVVYEGTDKILKLPVAIKVIDKVAVLKNPNRIQLINNEVRIHASLPANDNICRFYRLLEDIHKVALHHLGVHRYGVLWLDDPRFLF